MKKGILLLTMLVMILTTGIAQTITTGNVTSPICAGATISIPYNVTGTFTAGNRFVAQLSNSVRSFNTPVLLDSVVSTASGTITAKIPPGIPAGTAYKIRVIGRTPAITGSENSSDLIINTLPIITLSSTAGITTTVTTLAGKSSSGAINGTGTAASFFGPRMLATDDIGNLYVPDLSNGLIRKITPAGVVTTFASGLNGPGGVAVDASGNVYVAEYSGGRVLKYTSAGGAILATIATGILNPSGIAVDYAGNVYVAEQGGTSVYKFTPAGVRTTFASGLRSPTGVALDASGNVYVADQASHLIRKYIPTGATNIILAGSGSAAFADGSGTAASFNSPHGLAVDPLGNVYVADYNSHRVRKITPEGVVTTIGTGANSSLNGLGSAATFNAPAGIAIDPSGNIYVAEYFGHNIRKITQTTISCNGNPLTLSAGGGTSYSWAGPQTITNGTSFNSVTSGIYTVTATNANGCIAKQVIYDSVASLPVITGPTNSLASPLCSGFGIQTLSVSATVTGTGNTLSYQWYKGTGISTDTLLTNTTPFTTATTNALTLTTPSDLYKGNYYVKVTSSFGNCVVKSNNINVVINPAPIFTITSNVPGSSTGFIPPSASVTFTATNITNFGQNPTYQWTRNGNVVGSALTYTGTGWGGPETIACKVTSTGTTPCGSVAAITKSIIVQVENTTANSWVAKKAPQPTLVRRNLIGFSILNKGYIGLGTTDNTNGYSDFWEYDPEANSWTQKANFAGGQRFLAVAFSIGDLGYVGTGQHNGAYYKDFYQYSPSTNQWTAKADFPDNRSGAAGFSIGAIGYVGCGYSAATSSNTKSFYAYNSKTNRWNDNMPVADYGKAADPAVKQPISFSIQNKGYVGGGYSDGWKNNFYEYNPVGNVWTQKDPIPGPIREGIVSFSMGSLGYVGGGHVPGSGVNPNYPNNPSEFYSFNPANPNTSTTNPQWVTKAGFGNISDGYAFGIGNKGYAGLGWYEHGAANCQGPFYYSGDVLQIRPYYTWCYSVLFSGSQCYEYSPTATKIKTGNPTSRDLCKTSTLVIPYTIGSTTFNDANVFRAELSDEFGSFANPINISVPTVSNGTTIQGFKSAISGQFSAIIPANTVAGTKYRIRVVGSDPLTYGTVSDSAISVVDLPDAGEIGNEHTVPYPAHMVLDSVTNVRFADNSKYTTTYTWQKKCDAFDWRDITEINTLGINSLDSNALKLNTSFGKDTSFDYRRKVQFGCNASDVSNVVKINVFHKNNIINGQPSKNGFISGRVVSNGTSTGVQNVEVTLEQLDPLKGSNAGYKYVTTTDGSGYYKFDTIYYGDEIIDIEKVHFKISAYKYNAFTPLLKDDIRISSDWILLHSNNNTDNTKNYYYDSLTSFANISNQAPNNQNFPFVDYTTYSITGTIKQNCADCITDYDRLTETVLSTGLKVDNLNEVAVSISKYNSGSTTFLPFMTDTSGSGTNGNGNYALTVAERNDYRIKPTSTGYRFSPSFADFTIDENRFNVNFTDDTTHKVSGIFRAGGNELIGSVRLEFSDTVLGRPSVFIKQVTTSDSGKYSINLPPRKYKVRVVSYIAPFIANIEYRRYQQFTTTDNKMYLVVRPGTSGNQQPSHISGTYSASGGTAEFEYAGVAPNTNTSTSASSFARDPIVSDSITRFFNTILKESMTVDLTKVDDTLDFIFHRPPTMEIVGLNDTCNGLTVFYQYMPKKFAINLYEGKKFHNYKIPTDENDKVYVITSVINLNNENDTLITIPVNGVDSVKFIASAPNLFQDPSSDRSKDYMKYFELQYTDKYGRFIDSIKAKPFVDGYKAATGTFTTVTPEIPILILHQPPGDGSSSKWEQNNSTETVWRISREENNGLSGSFQVKLGPCFDVPVGGQDFSLETLRTISGEFSSSKTTVNQREAVVKTTNSVAYETTADGGDLFVGGALNMNYAVGDIRELVGCRINKRYDYVMQPTGYATTYTYSEKHIKEVLIPTLQDMADLITATDENSLKQKEKYQSSARTWSQVLDNNNHNKENASFVRNRSFDGAAGPITETTTAESSESNSIDISMEIDRTIGAEFGLFFAGIGASGTVSSNFKLTTGEGSTVTNTTETVIGYTLDDNDAGDYFSVDVSKDKVYNTPVFKMVAGTSSCPPEAGAQNRDLCILDISSNVNGLPNKVQRNIPANGEVLYQLLLRNNSESREARQFLLSFDQGSNPNGAIITIGGSPASTPVSYSIPFRGTQIVTVSVKKNPVSNVFSYEGLSFVLSDACDESAPADEKQSFSINTISAFFQSACSDINLTAPANNFSVNSSVDILPVTFDGYVRNNLQTVTIEYAHLGQGDWQTGYIINQNAIATNSIIGTTYPWDTHDVEDGNYEVRLKLTCSSGITYSNRATGIIDRTAPTLFGRPQPADNNYIAGDEISYTYNEYINTSNLNFDKVKLIRKENNYEIPVQVSGYQNKINIVPTQNLVTVYAGDTLLMIAKNITDLYGNIKTDPDTTLFVVGTEAQIAAAKKINITNLRSGKTSVYENSGDTLQVKFKFADNTPLTNNTTVKYLISGSAAYNSGYTVSYTNGQNLSTDCNGSQGTIVIPANSDSAVLRIHPVADFVYEENENITITLITGGDYRIGTSYMVKDTIINDDYNSPIITANRGLCPGGSILLTTPTQIEGINITAYQWRLNDTIVGTSTNTISVNRPGAYTVKVTTANGFTGLSNEYNVATSISPVSTTNMAICRGVLPYIWNGLSINAAGTYSATLSNSEGCDSIATLVFTIKEPTTGIETIYTDEAPYIWHDIEYYTSNDEATFTEVNAAGCDSVVTLNLTIANTCLNTRATFNVSACNSYTWHGMRITTSQTLLWYTINAAGCDSIETLNLIINKPTSSTTKAAICSNQMPYVYNGYTYNNPGTYSRRLVNAGGCDSIAKLIITLKYPTTSTSNVAVCNNQLPYVWNGLNLSTSGNYNVTLTNAVGCDSVANIVFTVKNTSNSTTVYTTCDNQLPYVWNGLTLNTTGNYSATLINAVGCDSVASINFSVNNTTSSLTTTTICSDGLPYAWNGQALTEAGTYIATLAGSNGCDSVATINLSVNESPIAVVNANGPTTFCSGGSVTLTAANGLPLLTGANDSAYASSIINISSEYLPCPNIWSSCQLLGAPNTYPSYGDIGTAWTTASFGNREFIEFGFNHSTPINYIDIYETYHPGYIDTVYVKNPNTGSFEVVYTGTAQNAGNQSRIMHIEFPTTAFNVSEIRIAINLEGFYNYYEIDAVKIGKRAVANETSVDQYLWSNGATTKSIVPSISGTYTVTATAPNGCSLTSAPVDVTILTNNTYAVTGGGSYCDGGTGNAIGLDGSEVGVRYQLKLNGGYVGQPQEGTGAALNFGVFNNQGRYTVDATNTTTGCTKAMSGFADISIIALPNFAVTPTAASVCIGEEVQLAVSDAINYCMPTNSNPSVSNISEVHLNTLHSYLNQQSNQVHFNEPVNNNTTMLVAGQSYELSLTTVSWANSNTSVWIDYNSNGLFESNEWVKLWSDARTGSVMINVPSNAINGLTRLRVRSDFTWYQLLAENVCSNRECGTTEDYMITIEGGLSPETLQYTWNNGASIGNTFVVTPSASTEYTVSTTSATTGCTKTITIPVTVNALPNAPVIVAGGSTALCAGSEVTLTIQGDEGVINSTEPSASYTWSNGATGASTTVNQVGSYTVTKTNLNGCSSTSAPVNITLKNSTTSITAYSACNNQLPYLWNGLTLNTAGNYSATLINAEGCDSVATINFSIKNTTSSLTNLTICNHELPYSWNGQTLPSGGTYSATLTGSNGCDSVAFIVLTTISSPIALINANGPTTFCAGGSVTLTTANQPVNESALILPLDLNSTSVLAVGLRKLKSSYNGSIIRLRRESDNAEQDFGSVGINLDVNAIDAWLEGSTGYCVKLYNQAGNVGGADVSQVDQSKQPVYVANGIYNRPMLHFNTSQNLFNNTNYPVPFSIVYGSRVTGYAKRVLSSVNNNWWLGYWDGKMDNASFGTWLTGDNTPQVDNQYIIYTGKASFNGARFFRNGVAITPSMSGSFSGPNGIKLNGGAYPGEESEVDFTDVLIYNTNLLPNDVTLINNAVNSYYTYVDNSGVNYLWSSGDTTRSITPTITGSYTVTATAPNGCSLTSAPINVDVLNTTTSTTELTVCSNQLPYGWNGLSLNEAGTYTATITNAAGCDSVATVILSVINAASSLTSVTICSSEFPYVWNNQNYTSSGNYTVAFAGNNGCDSLATLALNVNQTPVAGITTSGPTTVCSGVNVTLTAANQPVDESAIVLPLDLNGSSVLAVGLRKLKSNYNGSIIRLRRGSDNAEQDFGSVGINLDVNAINAWLQGSTGYCVTLYNQSGNGGENITQYEQYKQPLFVANGINNRPTLHFNTSMSMSNNVYYPIPYSAIYGSSITGVSLRALSSKNNNWLLGYWGGYEDRAFFNNYPWVSEGEGFTQRNIFNIYAATQSLDLSTFYKNGNELASNNNGLEGPNGIQLNGNNGCCENSDVDFTDVLIYNTDLQPYEISQVNQAISSYYSYVDNSGVNYLWSNGATTTSIVPSISGTYTVTATAPNGCTLTSVPVDVTILTNNTYAVTGGGSHCDGGTGNAIGLDGSEVGVQYQLKLNGGSVGQPQEGTGTALNFGVFNIQGRYTVDATNTTTGCTKVMSGFADINIISLPNFAVTPTTASVCLGEEVQFTASSVNNYCLPNSGFPSYANINQVHLNTLHSYLSGSQSQTHFNEPVNGNTTTLEAGQSYELSFNTNGGATSAVWIDYNNNRLFEPSEWVRPVTQGNSGSAMINIPANATSGLTRMRVRSNYYWQISAEDACSDLSYGSTEDYMITIQGGLPPETLQYTWNNGASIGNTFVATPSASTEFTVSTTSANTGCTKTITIPVTVNALPNAPVITTSGASTLCAGSDVTLTLQGNEGVINPTVPLDEVNGASLAVGLRKLNSNYNGAALRLRRSSDDAEQDFGFTGNNLDVNAITTWLDGADGYCTTLYDQSNNGGNVTQAINDKQPVFVLSGINNKPVLHFTTSNVMYNQVNYPAPFTAIYGARNTEGNSSGRILSAYTNNWLLGYWDTRMDVAFFEGWVNPESDLNGMINSSNNDYTIYAGKSNGSISSFFKNGNLLHSSSGGVTGPNGIEFNGHLGSTDNDTSNFDITDVIIYPTDLSTTNIVALNNSIGQYYGSGTLSSASYTWSNGTTGSSTIVNQLGSYTVTKTNLNGCSITSEPIVIGKMTAEISGNETICAGTSANVIISVTGVGPWSGTLSDGTAFSGTTSPIIVAVSPNTTTSYTIVSLNGPDCSVSAADLIGEASVVVRNVVSASISGSVSTCNSEPATININVTGDGPWFGTLDDGTAFSGNSNIISVEVNPTATAVYFIASLNGEYCMANPDNLTGTITVFVNELVTGTIAGNATICNGASAQLSITVTGKGPWSGTLNNGMTFSGSVSPILIDVTPTSTTTYSITSINGLECSALSSNLNGTATIQVNNQTTSINDVTICDNQLPYSWNNNNYEAAGTYSVTLTGSNGCDSVATINLVVNAVTYSTTNISICSNQLPFVWNDISISNVGAYTKTLVNAMGCDSMATLNFSIKNTSTSTTRFTLCSSELPMIWNGLTLTASGTYSRSLNNSVGCDSLAVIVLNVKQTSNTVDYVSAVGSYTWHGTTYTSSNNTAMWTGVNAVGCDSTVRLDLTITYDCTDSDSTLNVTACKVYVWKGIRSTTSTTLEWVGVNAGGCDSVVTLNLTITTLAPTVAPASITQTLVNNVCGAKVYRYTAAASVNATGYQWILPNSVGGVSGVFVDSGDINNSITIRVRYTSNNAAITGDSIKVKAFSVCGSTANRTVRLTNTLLTPPAAPASITATAISINTCGAKRYRYIAPPLTAVTTTAAAATGYSWSFKGTLGVNAFIDSGNIGSQIITVTYSNNSAAATGDSVKVLYTSVCGNSAARALKLTNTLLSAPLAPTTVTITPVQTNVCGARKYRYSASALATATASTMPATGWFWSLPAEGIVGSTGTIDSGDVNSQTIVMKYTSNAAAAAGDTIRVAYTSACGLSVAKATKLTNTLIAAPLAPATVTVTPLVTNICGARKYRYSAAGLAASTTTATAATGWLWSLPAEGTVGSTGIKDSGEINSQTIVVIYSSNAAAAAGDTIRVAYTSSCGLGAAKATKLTNTLLSAPLAPATVTIATVSDICGARVYRYTAPALPVATTTAGAANGYLWHMPTGTLGLTGVLDSGSLTSKVIRIRYSSNAAALTGDSIKLAYTSACGNSLPKAMKLSNLAPTLLAASATLTGTTSICSVVGTSTSNRYIATAVTGALSYVWTLPAGAVLDSGSNGLKIKVRFLTAGANDSIFVQAVGTNGCAGAKKVLKLVTTGCVTQLISRTNVPATIKTIVEPMQVNVYPNPSTSAFQMFVKTQNASKIAMRVLDIQGRLIKTISFNSDETIAFGNDLKSGVYIVELREGKVVKTVRVVKY